MAYNGMPTIPSVSQATLSITASAYSSFATPAITVPFPSVYGGQIQLAYTFTSTATFASTRIPTTIGGAAATAGVHSINEAASAAGYRTHDYGAGSGGSSWPVWATAVIASVGGAAIILLIAGLWCWRVRRKQKARKRAAAGYTVGGAGGKMSRKEKKAAKKGLAHDGGGAYREEKFADVNGGGGGRSSRAMRDAAALGVGAGLAAPAIRGGGRGGGARESRSRSRQSDYVSSGGSSYPPPASSLAPSASPSRSRARDLAALGINRPTSTTPSASLLDPSSPVYPAFALPKNARHSAHHERNFSGGSEHSLLPAPAPGFAYVEGPRHGDAGFSTPPRAAVGRPNTNWDDSPSGLDSPARLLTYGDGTPTMGGNAALAPESPRSSMTVSTRGTGGGAYRWDAGEGEHPMPDPGEVNAALGRAMLQHDEPVGVAVGAPEDAARWSQSGHSHQDYRYSTGAVGGGSGYQDRDYQYVERSTTPSYAPNHHLPAHLYNNNDHDATSSSNSHSQYTASRAPSRAATIVQQHPPMPGQGQGPSQSRERASAYLHPGDGGGRSTTPVDDEDEGRGGMSRSSTYRTAEEVSDNEDERLGVGRRYSGY